MILPYSLARHEREFARKENIYLSILRDDRLTGFIILGLDEDGSSVEFRRIVVATRGGGTGQQAIFRMEEYCRDELRRYRVWLDVFADNLRGQHIYRKLGYRQFDKGDLGGRILLYFVKRLE